MSASKTDAVRRSPPAVRPLSILALGHVHTDAFEPLTHHFPRIEQVVTNLDARVDLSSARPQLNRAIDAAANDWILIMREREILDDAKEIAETGDVWGYRIRTVPIYAGKPLRIDDAGELRLFHRRHLLRREWNVEGPTIRLTSAFHATTFESAGEHRAYLTKHAVPRSRIRQVLNFLRTARTIDANTLRYIWIEAGFDHSRPSAA